MTDDAGWVAHLDELAARRAAAEAMGGPERRAARAAEGRLDARARLAALFDEGTFRELGALVGGHDRGSGTVPADALVAGHGLVDGRPVLAGAEDFTVMGGSIGLGAHAKRTRLALLAVQERVPLVMLLEGAGERAQNALERYPWAPNDLQALAAASGLVPMVAVVMGASAGHGALTAPLADHVVMVEGAALFSAGPPLVAAATGEQVTKEELGGAAVHVARSGVAHDVVPDDHAALTHVRRYLAYFPSSAWERPPRAPDGPGTGTARRRLDDLLHVIPVDGRKPYDVRGVIERVADAGSVLEVQPAYGASMVTALARLGGEAIAVVANQPAVRAGAIDAPAADKAARFLQIADAFHLPALFLADNPGVLAGTAAERDGALRHAARLFVAQAQHRGPKLHVTLRKAYGFGSSLMAMNPFDAQTTVLALPTAELGAMPESGGAAAGVDLARPPGPWSAADTLSYDDVVDPRDLRDALLDALRLAASRLRSTPPVPRGPASILP